MPFMILGDSKGLNHYEKLDNDFITDIIAEENNPVTV